MAKYNENILGDMNTFVYKKSNWKRITLPNGEFKSERTGIETREYKWEIKGDYIIVNGKRMKIEYDSKFSYALRKTKVKSHGLLEVLKQFTNDDFWHQDADKILAWVVEHGKEVAS